MRLPPWLASRPRLRRALGAVALGGGAWLVLRGLSPVAPRELELRVSLRGFDARPVRAVGVELQREGVSVRSLAARFEGPDRAPREWRATVSTPPGAYRAEVWVQTDEGVRRRGSQVDLSAGAVVELAAPRAE